MNPYSPEAVAMRAALYSDDVAERDRLAEEVRTNPTAPSRAALERAERNLTATWVRMNAMGDPLPNGTSPDVPAGRPTSAPRSREDEVEAVAQRIIAARKAALGQ